MKELIHEHLALQGNWCPGTLGVPAHTPTTRMVVDHIVPLSQGGTNELSNLRVICADCNRARSRR